jgi:hypothetical protein
VRPAKRIHSPEIPSIKTLCMEKTDGQKIWMIAIDAFLSEPDTYGRSPNVPSGLCEGCSGYEDRGSLRIVMVEVEGEYNVKIKRGGLILQLGAVCALGAVLGGTLALLEHDLKMRHYNN